MYKQIIFNYLTHLPKTSNPQFIKLPESGYALAMYGLSLFKHQDQANMPNVAIRMVNKCVVDGGELKWLGHIKCPYILTLPRDIWQDLTTYMFKVMCSESTQVNINKDLTQNEILWGLGVESIILYNNANTYEKRKAISPESRLQTRTFDINYLTLTRIIQQRNNHKNHLIRELVYWLYSTAHYKELLPQIVIKRGKRILNNVIETNKLIPIAIKNDKNEYEPINE